MKKVDKRPVIQLIHPKLGIVSEKKIKGKKTATVITQAWRYQYGKKFLECSVKIDEKRKIIEIKTNKTFISIKEASFETKITVETIRRHLYGQKVKPKFKWEYNY